MALCHQDIPEVVDYILVSPIPPVLKHTMRRILEDGLQTEGIFRVPGNSTNIVKLKERFDAGITVDLKSVPIADVAGILKRFFHDLPCPLTTEELYSCFLAASGIPVDSVKLSCYRKVIQLMPEGNQIILHCLLAFLGEVASHSDSNMMTPKNIAIVFSPALLRDTDSNIWGSGRDFSDILVDAQIGVQVIEFLVVHQKDVIWGPKSSGDRPKTPMQDEESFEETREEGIEELFLGERSALRQSVMAFDRSFSTSKATLSSYGHDQVDQWMNLYAPRLRKGQVALCTLCDRKCSYMNAPVSCSGCRILCCTSCVGLTSHLTVKGRPQLVCPQCFHGLQQRALLARRDSSGCAAPPPDRPKRFCVGAAPPPPPRTGSDLGRDAKTDQSEPPRPPPRAQHF